MSDVALFNREEIISDFTKKLKPVGRILEDPDYNVWCCSPIYDEQGRVHVFYAKWLNEYDHLGWVCASEVGHAVADSPEGPYTDLGTVLKGERDGSWDHGRSTTRPCIKSASNTSCSTWAPAGPISM